jgi:hypothetical protein
MWIAVAAVAILAVIALIVALIATRGGGDDDDATATPTLSAPSTATVASTATGAPTATETHTPEPTATETPEPPTATNTPEPTATETPEPPTETPTTEAATATPEPPTATPEGPTPTTAPTTPTPQAGQEVYTADWSDGAGDWTLPEGWAAENGELISDGSAAAVLAAPFAPTQANYAVEAEIVVQGGGGCPDTVGVFARFVPVAGSTTEFQSGYLAAVCQSEWEIASIINTVENKSRLADGDFQLSASPNTYRLEVNGAELRFFVDGEFIGQVTNDQFDDVGVAGIYVGGAYELTVTSFTIFDL